MTHIVRVILVSYGHVSKWTELKKLFCSRTYLSKERGFVKKLQRENSPKFLVYLCMAKREFSVKKRKKSRKNTLNAETKLTLLYIGIAVVVIG